MQAGADPKEATCRAWRECNKWVIEGEKWYASNTRFASILIIMAITVPDAAPHERLSMLIVPIETRRVEIIRNVAGVNDTQEGAIHACLCFNQVRLPPDALLGEPGQGFRVAQPA